MKNKALTILMFFATIVVAFAGNKKQYVVADIPKTMLAHANAVLRTKTVVYERKDLNSATQKIHYAITILNKGGLQSSYFIQYYYKFSRITGISATVYDRYGKKVKTIPKKEIRDVAVEGYTSLYSDQRAKIIDPKYDDYPFTVEYTCTIVHNGMLSIPAWQVYPAYDVSVQEEKFTLKIPASQNHKSTLDVNYYSNDSSLKVVRTVTPKNITYSLHINNLQPVLREDYTWNISYATPSVRFSPKNFSISGYKGSFESWSAFGNFEYQLINGRDALSDETVSKIKSLVANDTGQHQTVEKLYKYMQNKVRYVSVQKGIGGWQPFKAEEVDKLSYGDCKALTNYMKSLLKAAEIPSDFTLVLAGSNAEPIVSNFPSNQFNHAILCVPLKADTVWLECTSQQAPCGYLGTFTDDRDVLSIDDNGKAVMLHTPAYGHKINNRTRVTNVDLTPSGDCDVFISAIYSGMFYDRQLSLCHDTRENQKKELLKQIHLSTITLKDFNFTEKKNSIPVINLKLNLNIKEYAIKSGNRLLITPYLFSKDSKTSLSHKKRHFPIVIQRSYSTIDTVFFNIPEGYIASNFTPKDVVSNFGSYHVSLQKRLSKMIYIRHLVINKGIYQPSDWQAFTAFMEQIDTIDKSKFALIKLSKQ